MKPNSGSMGLRRGEKRPSIPSGNAPALKWTEALTLISETHAPDDVDEEVRQYFSEVELVNLTTAIVSINCWKSRGHRVQKRSGHLRAQDAAGTCACALRESNEKSRAHRGLVRSSRGRLV